MTDSAKAQVHGVVAGQQIVDCQDVEVQTRSTWAGSWRSVDYLEPLTVTEAAAPRLPRATFRFRYGGQIKREDSSTFGPEAPKALDGHFIRVRVVPVAGTGEGDDPVTVWTGVVVADGYEVLGADEDGAPLGDEILTAYGLEFLLDRHVISTSWWVEDGESSDEAEAGWAPPFNERYRRGEWEVGNKGNAAGGGGDVFGGPNEWNFADVIGYLLDRFGPSSPEFQIGGQKSELDEHVDVVLQEGRTVRQILNETVARTRGLSWCVRVGDDDTKPTIHVFTTTGERVTFGNRSLSANKERTSLEFDNARDILDARISIDHAPRYDEILVVGERVRSCFTLRAATGDLDRTWTQTAEEAYIAHNVDDDEAKTDAMRNGDLFWRVFRTFAPKYDWKWTVKKSAKDDEGAPVVPYLDDDGKVQKKDAEGNEAKGAGFRFGKSFERFLPFERVTNIDHGEPEYVPPVAIVEIPQHLLDPEASTSSASATASKFYAEVGALGAFDGMPCQVRMMDRELGIEIKGALGTALAFNHWTAGESEEPGPTEYPPDVWGVDWSTLLVTVNVTTDERVKVRVKVGSDSTEKDDPRVLVIQVPNAELWWVVPGTVTGVGAMGTQLLEHGGGEVRDDTDRLRQVAAFAKAWYAKPRARVNLTLQKLYTGLRVGSFVTNAGASWHRTQVGTPVTMRTWDFEKKTTTISTDYVDPSPALMG